MTDFAFRDEGGGEQAALEEVDVTGCSPRLVGIIALVATFSARPAEAQTASERFELFVGAGVSRMGGDEGSLGSGGTLTVGLGAQVAGDWVVETDVLRAHHERSIAGGPLEGTATAALANIGYRFRSARVQPFALASLGVLHFSTLHTYPASAGQVVTRESTATQKTWGGAGGVNVVMTPHVVLRPQFRLLFSEQTGVLGLATTSIAAGYRW